MAGRSRPRKACCNSGRRKPRGKPDFLHDPSDIYAILYHSDRHALALDFAVRNARSARRTGRQKCGLPSTGQRLIAVLVPCFNEEAAVATVVSHCRKALPTAEIFVYDNNSKDRTVEVARAAGAIE